MMLISKNKWILSGLVILITCIFSREAYTSKFTHPIWAFVEITNLTKYTQDDIKKFKSIKSNYTWLVPNLDSKTCMYTGQFSSLINFDKNWDLYDLNVNLKNEQIIVKSNCINRIEKDKLLVNLTFNPIYDPKAKSMNSSGTGAKGMAVYSSSQIIVIAKKKTLFDSSELSFEITQKSYIGSAEKGIARKMSFSFNLVVKTGNNISKLPLNVSEGQGDALVEFHEITFEQNRYMIQVSEFNIANEDLESIKLQIYKVEK